MTSLTESDTTALWGRITKLTHLMTLSGFRAITHNYLSKKSIKSDFKLLKVSKQRISKDAINEEITE